MASSLPILTFHAIDNLPSVISFSPQVFRRGMTRLHESGYRTLSLLEAVDCVHQGKPFPDRSFAITFDDGYQTVFDEAFPMLQQYDMSAIIFLTVGEKKMSNPADRLPSLEGRSMLSWAEIREMERWGIAFGAHTLTHPNLTRLSLKQIEVEICDSKTIIEDALGVPVNCFAYPYGLYDHRSREIVHRHFACACSDKLGFVNTGSDFYALERIEAYYLRTDRLFDVMLTRFFPWYIWARSIPRGIRRTIQCRLV
jgi:peptidoglycan/xylan/chitin deacetylase (PgdA/CDA1 family)